MMRVDDAGRRFIRLREGYSAVAYDDHDGRPWGESGRRGTKTIGYGTTAADVSPLPDRVTNAEADELLVRGLAQKYEPPVERLFAKGGPLRGQWTQARFNALCSFTYNLGAGSMPFRNAAGRWVPAADFETIGRAIIAGDIDAIADAFVLYRSPGTVWEEGLRDRRLAEAAMFRAPKFTRLERRLMRARPTPAVRLALKAQARRVQLAARATPNGWGRHDRARRYRALRRRALTR